MKKITIPILPALIAVVLSGCNKSQDVYSPDAGQVLIGISAYSGMQETGTKAPVTGTVMPTGRTLVFSAYHNAAEGSSANFFTGINFTKKSGSNTIWETGKYWPLTGTLDFLGYCLDNNSRVSSVTWGTNVAASVQMTLADNKSNQDDLLVGGASALTPSSNAVVFKHAEALLTFKASSTVAYDSSTNYGITINSITVNNAYYGGRCTATRSGSNVSFSWASLANQANVVLPSMTATNLTTSAAAIGGTPGLLVIPQTETSFTINYTLHNGKDSSSANVNNTMQYTYTPASPMTWQPGKKYVYNIAVTLTGIEITASMTDWDTQTATPVAIP